jgi:g-D-glutamyl-meso-diaminopimelate peptidase
MDYQALTDFLSKLQGSEIAQVSVLTRSILGREIPLITLGRGKQAVLYVGAHHGMEGITCGVLLDFIADFIKQYEKRSTVYEYPMQYLLEERCIHIVPMLNPDGVEYTVHGVGEGNPLRERVLKMNGGEDFSKWQANARGVDLNHNYDAGFLAYKRKEAKAGIMGGAPTRYSGEYPESEPECAALSNVLRTVAPSAVLSLHMGEDAVYLAPREHAATRRTAERIARLCACTVRDTEGAASYGSLCDYAGEVLAIPSFALSVGHGETPPPEERFSSLYDRISRVLFRLPALL